MAKNKLLTRDNLQKRQHVEDATCFFCNESESIEHLFFGCVVAKELWRVIGDFSNSQPWMSISNILEWWSSNKNRPADCLLHSAALWALWKYRNDMYFNRIPWSGMQVLWRKTAATLDSWAIRCSDPVKGKVLIMVRKLEQMARSPPLLLWPDPG